MTPPKSDRDDDRDKRTEKHARSTGGHVRVGGDDEDTGAHDLPEGEEPIPRSDIRSRLARVETKLQHQSGSIELIQEAGAVTRVDAAVSRAKLEVLTELMISDREARHARELAEAKLRGELAASEAAVEKIASDERKLTLTNKTKIVLAIVGITVPTLTAIAALVATLIK